MSDDMPVWEQRFRAPSVGFPTWARDAPDRLVFPSNESGAWQVYAWDRGTGGRRRVTDDPIGVAEGAVTPDGARVVWFHDATGDEVGRWMAQPFGGGEEAPLVAGVPDAWSAGLAIGDRIVVAGTSDEDGYQVWVAEGDAPARVVHSHAEPVAVAGLSRDGRLVALEHSEHGDSIHPAVRVIDPRTGRAAGEQWDGTGRGLSVAGWSRVAGDQRVALVHEREGKLRPAVWNLTTGERRDLPVDLPGDVSVAGWWPDGSALLLAHEHEGRDQLYKMPFDTEALLVVVHPAGTVSGAGVHPDGEVWYRLSSGAEPPAIRGARDRRVLLAAEGAAAPPGQPYRSWHFTNRHGQPIHGFLATPAGDGGGPYPVLMHVHGGPTWAYTDSFSAEVQAWVDHGFAVAMVNYRGSTGYGTAFRDALIGNPGFPEVEDIVAGLDDLVASGLVDPARVVLNGGSWGGYVTLLGLGTEPERWAAGVAAVPVADYPTAFRDEAPVLQAFDRDLFGGAPDEVGDLYVERSPLTYVDRVKAPVLIIAGDNDSRCPIQQVLNYVDARRALGGEVELYRFDAGHGSMVMDERVRQMAKELEFVLARVSNTPT
ncbi:MAG: S9 family peptidase [Acidimicrobiales bacterium]